MFFSNYDLTRKVESNCSCHDDPLVSGNFLEGLSPWLVQGPKVVSTAMAVDWWEVILLGTWSNLIFCLRHKPIIAKPFWLTSLPLHTKRGWLLKHAVQVFSLKCRVGRQKAIKLKHILTLYASSRVAHFLSPQRRNELVVRLGMKRSALTKSTRSLHGT